MSDALDRLTIRGFKSIRNLDNLPLTSLNVLIGANGAGKSNFLEFFSLLRAVIDGNLYDYIREGGGINDFLFNGRQVTEQISFEIYFGQRGYRFALKPGPLENVSLMDEARYYHRSARSSQWWELGNSPDGTSLLVKEALGETKDSQYSRPVHEAIASWQVYHFHNTSATAPMRHHEIIQDDKRLRFNGANLAPYLLGLRRKHPDAYVEIRNCIRVVLPFFDDFLLDVEEFGPKRMVNLSWRQKGSDYPMQPYHLSDGSIRFICLATALLQPDPPPTIIIDEPELGLHPYAITILAELVQSAARRTQLIIATQSPAFIDHFEMRDIIVVDRENGASTFKRLDQADYYFWLQDYSVGELWTKNLLSGEPVYE